MRAIAPNRPRLAEPVPTTLLEPDGRVAVPDGEGDLDLGGLARVEEQVPAVPKPGAWLPIEDRPPLVLVTVHAALEDPPGGRGSAMACPARWTTT